MGESNIKEGTGAAWVQDMGEDDLDEVLSIEAASRQTSWSRSSFVGEMENPVSRCLVLKEKREPGNQTLGFICFRVIGEESEIVNLGVHPLHRRRGIGRQLMRFYIDFCSERRVKSFSLETGISNEPAITLYRSFGYRIERIRSRFYRGKEDAVLMVRKAPSPGES